MGELGREAALVRGAAFHAPGVLQHPELRVKGWCPVLAVTNSGDMPRTLAAIHDSERPDVASTWCNSASAEEELAAHLRVAVVAAL